MNHDPGNKNHVAKLIFQDLYTAFYYIMYFWYIFILSVLKEPSQLAIDKVQSKNQMKLKNLLFTNFSAINHFYTLVKSKIHLTFPKVYLSYGLDFPKFLAAFRDMGSQLQSVKN